MFEDFRAQAAKILEKAGIKAETGGLEEPPDPDFGDLAFPCFELAKKEGKKPVDLAKEIVARLDLKGSVFRDAKVVGPYINFFFDRGAISEAVVKEARKSDYGSGKSGEKIMMEYPAPNTNKPLHVGHMRNMAIGESISRIFEKNGSQVFRVNLLNNRGIHVCKSMLAYQKWGEGKEPEGKSDHFVGDFYVLFAKKAKENPELEKEAQKMLRKWESGDREVLVLWKKMNQWTEAGMEETFKRFGIRFDKVYRESEMYKMGREMVMNGLQKGVFRKDDTGAIFFDLTKQGLDKKFLIRADGTTLYVTQDLYLARLKYEEFNMDKSVYVVSNEQNYHFDVLFALLEELRKLGFSFARKNVHLNYGYISLPSGRMKSREGTVVDADDLMDEVKGMALEEVKKRNKMGEKEADVLAEKISLSAIKFFLLKYDEYKDFVFRPEESLSFEGETGPYLQYSLVRAKKILEKAKENPRIGKLAEDEEFMLTKKLAKFPGVVKKAAENYKPHLVANYAYELASLFSKFYENCPVVGDEKEGERLAMVQAFIHVMRNCLELMGIYEVEMM
ncbi:MAG: arginine--tRNA ligase [archaeon]|nr:MAG: arginine--tRNA ligase [archaeon]